MSEITNEGRNLVTGATGRVGRHIVDGPLRDWESLTADPELVTRTVEDVTGVPARSFRERVAEHATDPLPTTDEVAQAYVSAFRRGRMDEAIQWYAEEMVRVAPLETGGVPVERRGLAEIMANARRLTADVEIHRVDLDGPFLAADRFAVRFTFDETHRPTGTRRTTSKMSLYAVERGRITREEIFYFTPPQEAAVDEPRGIAAEERALSESRRGRGSGGTARA